MTTVPAFVASPNCNGVCLHALGKTEFAMIMVVLIAFFGS